MSVYDNFSHLMFNMQGNTFGAPYIGAQSDQYDIYTSYLARVNEYLSINSNNQCFNSIGYGQNYFQGSTQGFFEQNIQNESIIFSKQNPQLTLNVLAKLPPSAFTNIGTTLQIGDSFQNRYNPFSGGTSTGWFVAPDPAETSTSVQSTASVSTSTNTKFGAKDLNFWKSLGYDPDKGNQLVANAKKSKYRGQKHQCVAVVRESINDTYYGGQTHYSRFNKACNIGDEFLQYDSHFKKIIPDWNMTAADFPPGAIIVYNGDNGNGGYVRGDNRGHGEIADGSGRGISNYDLGIKPQYIKEVWIPV